ncbi:hypothetical protein [Streptomyces sp. NPDC007991]|uniref:hypothetical protein n=1 Tax=Streptomyces sp. NPDC007991 TaxID=3364803 RepID=UPI0036EEB000
MVRRLRERVGAAGRFEEGAQRVFTGLQLAGGERAVGVGDVSGRSSLVSRIACSPSLPRWWSR